MACRVNSDVVKEVISFLENSDNLNFWSSIVHPNRPQIFSPDFLTSPIQVSAIFGLADLLDRLLEMADDLTSESWLALIHESMNLAIEQGHVEISLKLYRKMRELTVHPPLHKAAERGFIRLIEEILSMDPAGTLINVQDASGYTPLLYAAQGGHKDIVDLLLRRAADPCFAATDDTQTTALHLASRIGQVDVAQVLINYGADPKASDSSGYDPL